MKSYLNLLVLLLCCLLPGVFVAQQVEQQTGDTTRYQTIIPEAKQGLLKNMNMIANMQFALRSEFVDGDHTTTRFKNEQFRLEFRGQVTNKLYFRFRDRYTRAQTSESVDNLSRSTDLAYIRIDASDKLSIYAGKLCADWGGFEFDYNPIDIYEYSDIIEYADNFLTGAGVSYNLTPNHQFTFQVLDSRTKTFTELYGPQPNFTESKVPLSWVINWRGSLLDGKLKTIWSYSINTEAHNIPEDKNANMSYVALGTELTLGKFVVAYDFKLSDEDLDRTTIVSNTVPDNLYAYSLQNCEYIGHWAHLHYRLSNKINLSLMAMLDTANWNNADQDTQNPDGETHIRDAWGFIPTFEYYPWDNYNLRFFVNYVGRTYEYSDYAKSRFGAVDNTTGRFNIGFVSPVGIF